MRLVTWMKIEWKIGDIKEGTEIESIEFDVLPPPCQQGYYPKNPKLERSLVADAFEPRIGELIIVK